MNCERENIEAWMALARLSLKLNIIDASTLAASFGVPDSLEYPGPLAHGASLGFFDEWDAVQLVADKLSIKAIVINKHNVHALARAIDSGLLEKMPLEQWRALRAAPVGRERGSLVVAFANPLARHAKQAIDFALGESCVIAIAPEAQILNLLTRRFSVTHEEEFAVPPEEQPEVPSLLTSTGSMESRILSSDIDAPPVVRLVNKIFLEAFERGASDIHVSPEKEQLTVKMRTDGLMTELLAVPGNLSLGVLSRMKLLAGMDISEKRRPQDGRLRIQVGSSHRDLRVSTVPTLYGENLVARVLNSDPSHISFASLGMPQRTLDQLLQDLSGSSQVILVTGPTGSGKTSTLYAALMQLRDGLHNIVTIEDPIEYRLSGVTQIQVNQKIGMTFADALRSVLRQDPDVVVVGEIRDGETASIAMQTAQTGHVVLATLHTNSAAAAITRLRDLNIPPYLIASSIRGVMAQRLVRRLCDKCATPDERPATLELFLSSEGSERPLQAVGCDECGGSGYVGRIGVYSYLHLSDEVRFAIRETSGEAEIEEMGRKSGFASLAEAAIRLIAEGTTSFDEVTRIMGTLAAFPSKTELPVTRVMPSPVREEPPALAVSARPQKKKILVVEDDENLRFVLVMVLERAMYEVVSAENGQEALDKVFVSRPDLIICDLMMPHMDGTETVQILRRDPETRMIPVLMLTAADTEENEIKLLQTGADDFVSKTVDQRVLLSRIDRLLQRSSVTK